MIRQLGILGTPTRRFLFYVSLWVLMDLVIDPVSTSKLVNIQNGLVGGVLMWVCFEYAIPSILRRATERNQRRMNRDA